MKTRTKIKLEEVALLVDSDIFAGLTYVMDRDGPGVVLLSTKVAFPISDPVAFIREFGEVYKHMKGVAI